MINFFRKIRQNLLSENKFSKYLIYAIGEIILVVIGILIALQINNWNETRKTQHHQQLLIASLLEDFEYTYNDINNDELPYLQSLKTDISRFQEFSRSKSPLISVDSLRVLARSFFRINHFNPNLTTYNDAVSSGKLGLLKNKELMNQFTRFMQYLKVYNKVEDQSSNSYYNGAFWELRKTIDPELLYGRSKTTLTYEEYQKIISSKLTVTTLRNHETLNKRMYNSLQKMSEIIDRILELLKEMQTVDN
jgi:hypothetical protein